MLWLAFILPLGMIMWASLSKMVKKKLVFGLVETKVKFEETLTSLGTT